MRRFVSMRRAMLVFMGLVCVCSFSEAAADTGSEGSNVEVISKLKAFPMQKSQGAGLASSYYSIAKELGQKGGQSSLGWLFLLAALDFEPSNPAFLEPVVDSYLKSGDYALAIGHLRRAILRSSRGPTSNSSEEKKRLKTSKKLWKTVKAQPEAADFFSKDSDAAVGSMPPPHLTLPFSTAIARWNLYEQYQGLESEIKSFYDAVIRGYNLFKSGQSPTGSGSTDTKLNHDFYDWQMIPFKQTRKYWSGFEELPVFHKLSSMFRSAAKSYLMSIGLSEQDADLKSRSRTVIWASVHTGESYHGPHNTEDSMVGGVFYVKVPPNSGSLLFSDPRGKNSVMQAPSQLPTAPFHQMFQVNPYDGLLILFPGWLVHQVAPSVGLDVQSEGYRVSISFNLNGEWSATAPATYDNVKIAAKKNEATIAGQDQEIKDDDQPPASPSSSSQASASNKRDEL